LYGLLSRIRCTCELPVAVCQFFTSSLMSVSPTLSALITALLAGERIFTVGSGGAGSGLGVPSVSVAGGAGAAGGPASASVVATVVGAGAGSDVGAGGGGGGGGGRLSVSPPQAARARTSAEGAAKAARVARVARESRRFMARENGARSVRRQGRSLGSYASAGPAAADELL
jgi:hypothetical protein